MENIYHRRNDHRRNVRRVPAIDILVDDIIPSYRRPKNADTSCASAAGVLAEDRRIFGHPHHRRHYRRVPAIGILIEGCILLEHRVCHRHARRPPAASVSVEGITPVEHPAHRRHARRVPAVDVSTRRRAPRGGNVHYHCINYETWPCF